MTMAVPAGQIARITGVTHTYGKVLALDNVSFDLPSGRMTGLIGPDGAGKSTLLGLIGGARKLQIGTVQVLDGSMANAGHRRAVCTRIAYMPQGLGKNLYQEISVAENLAFFGTLFGLAAGEREMRIRKLAGATGLLPFLDRPVGKLSGGMKQKLGLCCALIHEPDLLILDEPTTGVDPLSRRQFWTLIADLRHERPMMSVVVSTAYMDEANHCDWLVAMDHGKVLAFGTADELRKATGEQDLESVFVALQPGQQSKHKRFVIPPRKPCSEEPVIVAKGLTRRFGKFTAVDRVSFTIEKGEIFGFLGSNGCGKTTTMKMLTGLLAASEGEAEVCGSPVDANDLSIRRRVGFMTQSFSLYGELTVRQNLLLHARLFHLSNAADRSEELIKKVGLTGYADADASSLPLGVRQRLSLAVAIVHDPELLILDEPTSGVDPQARDDFWRLLVDLSRSRNVTIFVSTHFMNEAMRCDRISLMHAGRVLVCDTPENVIASKNGADLEEAFIAYIEEAEGSRSAPATQEALSPVRQEARVASPVRPRFMPLRRLLAYTQCEMLSLMRDPIRLAFAFLGSLIIMLIFGFGLSNDVTNLAYAAFDHDNTPESRAYLGSFSSSPYFTERSPIQSVQGMEDRLKSNDIELAIEIPSNFGRMVKRGSDWQVSAWIDGANTTRAATIEGYVQQAHNLFSEQRSREASTPATSGPTTTLQVRYRYNPTAESIYSIGPSLPAMLMMMFLAILMAVSVAREKEIGTITNFYVTPTTRLEFLIGKQLPYLGVGMINFVILTATVLFLFEVPLKGNGMVLALGALLYTAAATGYGLFISTLTRSQVTAVFAGAVLSMLPTMQFSGMMQPVSTLEGGARLMGRLWPTTYYMHMSVGAFTKGLGFGDMATDLLALALFPPAFLMLSMILLKKQEK
ncbi:ribosome-associated ATPase/putative transporter RbbA [Mesorhizobium helmanticense]|uniref:Multidrug ABC transporter ATP-binding protein n=1 Tax=Mesorhizobium helmanticense TaxID=1776423 RepID=A0A2T4J2A6_9HYPH|nr:ribosome-associated ATPase/putative transporter RbbA [Mesorhizobium helmanticense]PTE12036.1 multidrug ABC transporter ATP-binding protein [Mesorhizobium helmanticense]